VIHARAAGSFGVSTIGSRHWRKGKKNRAKPGFSRSVTGSDKDRVTKAAADLSQFGERKFLNFNRFNDCHIHDNPLLRVMTSHLENHGCLTGNP
jgi:hypothetical protein